MDQYLSFNQIWSKQARLTFSFPFFEFLVTLCASKCSTTSFQSQNIEFLSTFLTIFFLFYFMIIATFLKKFNFNHLQWPYFSDLLEQHPKVFGNFTEQQPTHSCYFIFCTIRLVQISLSPDEDVVIH